MRKLIVVSMMSLDGFYAGTGGDLMLLPFDGGAFDSYNLERIQAADTVLLGSNSYSAFSTYWPALADDTSAPKVSREFSRVYNEVEKVVVSDRLSPPDAGHPWARTTRILSRAEAHDTLADLTDYLTGADGIVGYRAKRHSGVIDVDRRGAYPVEEFWERMPARQDATLILDPNEFYILASREAVHVPPDYAAEMVPFDPLVGEFRVHYAGFFDPGFGHSAAGGEGSRAVLEVRSREVPFLLGHGQTIGRLVYERMAEQPTDLYGSALGSNYQAQSLKLSKHFKPFPSQD
jgi:deoxycytidine triphosphate deaminase